MTAPQAVSQQNPSKVAFGKVLAIQIVAYVVLVALALVPGIAYGDSANPAVVPFTIIGSLAMIALLVVFSPFRDGTAGHVIAVIAGLLSVVCATTMTLGKGVPIESVSKMLGHTNIQTTQIYARITNEKISHDMENLAKNLGSLDFS